MSRGESMKNKNFLQSVACAFRGLKSGFCTERNLKIYLGIALLFLILNVVTGSGLYDYILFLMLVCGVFSTEYINTSIERLCDNFSTKESENTKFIKDVAAGAVLCMGIAFFGVEGVILVSNIMKSL